MRIRNKLSLLFTVLTATILLAFASSVYYSAYKNRETEFYKRLRKEALTKANLFFKGKVDAKTLQTIYLNNREILNEVEVAIYDTDFHLLYHDAVHLDFVKETLQMIDEVRSEHVIRFYQNDWQVVGMEYRYDGKSYVVVAAAYDLYGYNKLRNLGRTILIIFICSIVFIYAAGRFLSAKALNPIVEMNNKAKDISATNLHLRIDSRGRDEIAELSNTFNEMLERLETSFDSQKDFVSNISHELRTPLSAIITELQLSRNKERSVEEYKAIIDNALHDANRLVKLSNSLLDFAKASYDASVITFKEVRLDETLMDAQNQVIKSDKTFSVSLAYETELHEESCVRGNEYLLKTAFVNLMENACKFSDDKHCSVTISIKKDQSVLSFKDKGTGIPEEDLEHIFTPFYRGENKHVADGNGIGLSLTKRIVELHHGSMTVISTNREGTLFRIVLPNTAS